MASEAESWRIAFWFCESLQDHAARMADPTESACTYSEIDTATELRMPRKMSLFIHSFWCFKVQIVR